MRQNIVLLTGRICRAEFRTTHGGKPVLNAKLAVSDGSNLAMVDIVFWDLVANKAQQLIDFEIEPMISVEGSLRQDRWTSSSGQPRTKLSVHVKYFAILADISEDWEDDFEQEV
jgi:single-stranded DNA-binding protein